ncbi:hypothetical protein QTI39_01410 [Clostridium perfringens]|uniref:hypothetical protein n=2 Tax=Clostridium perfringens TaxID=1502 RepID=UPI001F2CA958|nr:hypothetical protein [Clostridium perfringens]EJT5918381.1 site-specific integrase [Clostridium perfringens]MDH5065379.1 Phage integrase family protein [Clostridium perfringens]MDM0808801.1 hypothetical protein [Clostridium perfringens]MDM0839997.1 hypothetical protein [Clostridium perfringens]UBL02923.1 hypothetical protein KLF24_11130 [Clostridium perfringens]
MNDINLDVMSGRYTLTFENKYTLWIDVDNKKIRELLQSFINKCDKKAVVNSKMRWFLKGFNNSLRGIKVTCKEDFTEKIFYIQYDYYCNLDKQLREKSLIGGCETLKNKLVAFYRFLTKYFLNNKGFKSEFLDAINNKSFYKFYENGYIFVYNDGFTNMPNNDKFCIIPTRKNMIGADCRNTSFKGFDISACKEEYKNDLRAFIWNNFKNSNSLNNYKILIDFINYCTDSKKIYLTKDNNDFNDFKLWEYKGVLESNIDNNGNLKAVFKTIRKFLSYYKNKYNLSDSFKDIFSLKNLESHHNGGKIITEKDIDLIYRKLKEKEKENMNFRIYTIVFELFLTTKYRIGTILNLRRDSIIKISESEYSLKYLTKVSDSKYVEEKITIETANLINEALNLSKDASNEPDLLNEYIFIEKYLSKHRGGIKRIKFDYYFKKIINELKDELDDTYSANNIRHTFINNVYVEGRSQGIDLHKLAIIAGNGYKTAKKYYRDSNELMDYLEATNQICISDVNINGKIIVEDYEKKAEVREGLGVCDVNSCSFEIGECLICRNFITFINRERNFEIKLKEIDYLLNSSNNDYEIEELQAYKKLLLRYLYEIKEIIKKGKG